MVSRRKFIQASAAVSAPLLLRPALAALTARLSSADRSSRDADLCRKLGSDPLRPQFHLLPAHNWMNDPNGPIFFNERYHMFYQYNPQGAEWGNMNWAHATSPDMVHWSHDPIAISPTPGGPDRDGVFSGSAILDGATPTMIYTGVAPPAKDGDATLRDGVHTWQETQCLATSDDKDLRTWRKLAEPVIAAPPPGLAVTGFRDPYVWREGDFWMLTLGSGVKGQGGMVLLYRSTDLRHWTYLHPLVEGTRSDKKSVNSVDTGEMWECPDFFPLGNKHVLLVSTMGKVIWKVGAYKDQRFYPEKEGVADWGSYYAAKSMLDRHGNRVLWGWINETRPQAEYSAAGWAGVMALPRVLTLSAENDLRMDVSPAVEQLRDTAQHIHASGNTEARRRMEGVRIRDLSAELQLECKVQPESTFTLFLQSEGGEKFATLACVNKTNQREFHVAETTAPVVGDLSVPFRLRMILDASVLEVFANGAAAITARVYRPASGPLRLAVSGNAEIASLDVWPMRAISNNRLTGPFCE